MTDSSNADGRWHRFRSSRTSRVGFAFSRARQFRATGAYVGEKGPSTVFNPETGRWLESMNRPNESELRCVVPRVLLPCELRRCRLR